MTGGGSGLGAATVRHLAAAGANVAIADVQQEAGATLAAEIGARASFSVADVTDETQVSSAIAAARKTFGAVHGAISCAGVAPAERVLGRGGPHRLETFRRAIEINQIGRAHV